jgi:hypothetical protein
MFSDFDDVLKDSDVLMQAVALLVSRPQSRNRFDIPVHTDTYRYGTEFNMVTIFESISCKLLISDLL